MFYGIGSVVQHHWCNIYTQGSLADKLSSNHVAITAGIVLWILGESINFYHHVILANLRPSSTSSGYVIPSGGLFHYIVCPHYLGWVLCCCTQGLKNVPSSNSGQVHFPSGQIILILTYPIGKSLTNWIYKNLTKTCPEQAKFEICLLASWNSSDIPNMSDAKWSIFDEFEVFG